MACLPNHCVVALWEEPGVISVRPVLVKAQVSFMYQCLVVPYINPINRAPGVQTGSVLGIKSFHKLLMGKT